MALQIEYLTPAELLKYERNARKHSPDQIAQIVNSIREFGFTNPVLIDEGNTLIAGHGRLAAAQEFGLDTIPCIRLRGLTDNQIKALRIADNQLALNASWDLDLLAAELSELNDVEWDMELLGFDDDFLNGLLPDPDMPGSGEADQSEDMSDQDSQKVPIMVGPYEIKVKRSDFDKWESALRAKVGFDQENITTEIKARLKIK